MFLSSQFLKILQNGGAKEHQGVLPASVINPLGDALTLGGSPLLKKPLFTPTFGVVGGGDQNKATREDPYQDISSRELAAHPPSNDTVASAAGAVETRAALAVAFAKPQLSVGNVFLKGTIQMLLDV